jgi:cytochrome c peroxidase
MKRSVLIVLAMIIACSLFIRWTGTNKSLAPAIQAITHLYEQRAKTLDSLLEHYPIYFYDSSHQTRKKKYEELVYHYKRASGFLLYFEPDLYYEKLVSPFQFKKSNRKGLSGLVPDNFLLTGPVGTEPDSLWRRRAPGDSLIWKAYIAEATSNFRKAINETHYKSHLASLEAPVLFDALRREMFRISAAEIGNAEFWIEEAGMPSLNGSMDSWLLFTDELVKTLPSKHAVRMQWSLLAGKTKKYLAEHTEFRSFDRMHFIREHLIPLSALLNELQVALKVPYLKKSAALRANAKHVYDKNIFMPDFFAPNEDAFYSAEKAKLGELLFFDPILSDNNQRACASCHKPGLAFTDTMTKSTSFDKGTLPRNSPTVINAGFQKKQFWDQRAGSLEDQLDSVINNPSELHSTFATVIDKINASPEYVRLFHKAFPATSKKGITKDDVKNAIGVYERTLTGMNSRFDQYMRGDNSKLSQEEINGFNIYMGKARCGVCHIAPLFNGALPPFYEMTDHHSIGVPIKDTMDKYKIDPDTGMSAGNNNPFLRFSFKTPTMRNIALTAPYMHNGVYKTLEQVINFYDHGAGQKFSKDYRPDMGGLPFLTTLPFPLNLTEVEKKELIAFLRTLTDTSTNRTPARLPELKGKYAGMNKRVIGGEY